MTHVRTAISEKLIACIIKVFLLSVFHLPVAASVVPSSPILILMMEVIVPPKRRFLQEPHVVTSQKTASGILNSHQLENLKSYLSYAVSRSIMFTK
jgi:hypothetical protein